MKSNSVFLQYVYRHGQSFSITESIKNTITDHLDKMDLLYNMWIDDDSWLTLPKDDFDITHLNLNSDGSVNAIQFTERK